MRESDTYCLPIEEEVLEQGIGNRESLKLLEAAAEYEEENPSLTELKEYSSQAWSTVSDGLNRFEEAGLLEFEEKGPNTKTYRLTDKGLAIASMYLEKGMDAFTELKTDKSKVLSEINDKGGKALSTELYENYSGATIDCLKKEGELELQKLDTVSIVHLPDVEVTMEDRMRALQDRF